MTLNTVLRYWVCPNRQLMCENNVAVNIGDRNSLIVFVCYLTPFCFLFSVICQNEGSSTRQ